jgi:organic radical activating enzyme
MSKNIHCPMIHGGLNINLKVQADTLYYNQCCLSTTQLAVPDDPKLLWNSTPLQEIRQTNTENRWLDGCWQCQHLESAGLKSFRQAMIEGLGPGENLSGPKRIDLLFDRSCNLACRTCGPEQSTFWEKHLRDNRLPVRETFNENKNIDTIKNILETLDLSNMEQVQFCGGETLMGNTYWKTAQLLSELIPNAKDKVLLGFQTNGTQPINEKYYEVIEKFNLVKLMISLDGTHDRFDYLRWPANWNQVVDNIFNLKEKLPGNVMFFVQETTSCLSLFYYNEVRDWVNKNFNTNRFGDRVDYTTHLANHAYLDVNTITQEYVDAMKDTVVFQFISPNWKENPAKIKQFIRETEKFDQIRGQDWKKTFPEVANFYSRYLQ